MDKKAVNVDDLVKKLRNRRVCLQTGRTNNGLRYTRSVKGGV